MKNMTLIASCLLMFSGCATVSPGGSKVFIEVVSKQITVVEAAQKKFESMGCKYVTKIDAPIATGSNSEADRFIIGLKNKTAEVGGNVVISSLEITMGLPMYTKGIVYKCEKDLVSDGV